MRKLLLLLVVLGATACAAGTSEHAPASGGDPDLISSQQLRSLEGRYWTAYSVIERLRGSWLRSRSTGVGGERPLPNVFVDGLYEGGVRTLLNIDVTEIERLEYLSAPEATTRFGGSFPGAGAILVQTRGRSGGS